MSSITVVNEVARRAPELVPVLFEEFYWHDVEPQMPSPVYFTRPICRDLNGRLNTFFIPWYIRRAQELPDVPRMTAAQEAALRALETIANEPERKRHLLRLWLAAPDFDDGDAQLRGGIAVG